MIVRDIMETGFITVAENATYKDVAEKVYASNTGSVFVLDAENKLVGIVSEHDLLRILFPYYQSYYLNPEQYTDPKEREKKIEEVQDHVVTRFMSKNMHSASPDEPIMRVGASMLAKNVRRLPVLHEGVLLGVVTRQQIYRALYETHLK